MAPNLKPIFVATHPRACSTAFERVFMTRRDSLLCAHEPFGDAFYFGPERLADRYAHDEEARIQSGFAESTYKTIMDRINRENTEGKRIFIKDMAQYLIPQDGKPVSIAPSLLQHRRGVGTVNGNAINDNAVNGAAVNGDSPGATNGDIGSHFATQASLSDEAAITTKRVPYESATETGNPTVVPSALLSQFHFAFLIRHPKNSIPSFYRCCDPPLDKMTGWFDFRPNEAGYIELRRLFDYVRSIGLVGSEKAQLPSRADTPPHTNGAITNGITTNGHSSHDSKSKGVQICVIDADDLLDKPSDVIEAFCNSVGITYDADMLNWDTAEEHSHACEAFEKWKGWHEDAIDSKDLKPRAHKRVKSFAQHQDEWVEKYGKEGAEVIRKTVDENVEHYEYLKQFCVKV